MSESQAPSEDASVTFHVKSSSGPKCTLTLPLSTTVSDLKTKLAGSDYANVPANAQRLIYSGKVLKDHETLATHNVKEGNTMHLVRSAASNQRQNPANENTTASTTSATPSVPTGVPQTFAAGTGNDPLAGLTGARYAGFAGLPNMQELANPPTMDDMVRRLQDPSFAQQMNEALQNPQMIDMMINMNPQLRAMGPQARQMLQSEQFRRMMTNPEAIRNMMEMQRAFGNDPFGGLGGGGGGGQEAFPMPGATNTTDQQHRDQAATQGQGQQPAGTQNPFANPFAAGMNPFMFMPPQTQTQQTPANASNPFSTQTNTQPPNPFLALFPQGFGQPATQTTGETPQAGQAQTTTTDPSAAQANPFANLYNNPLLQQLAQQQMQNPEAIQQALQLLQGGAGAGFDPMAMFGGGGGAGFGQPADTRPPAERYATQLGQLNEMGFYNYEQNIQALTRSGGDVNGALEWLFNQPQV